MAAVKPEPKGEAFVVNFCDNEKKIKKSNKSLQDAFIKYKKKRQKEIRKSRKRREIPDETRLRAMADPDRMWSLRMKFVEQCKKYFGVPYAKKYWTPADGEFYSSIFLDCCGLVRRVMRDLSDDFGFKIGPWNQSYQCDTLPIMVESEEEMKAGDLVFISATYNNPKMKKQKHDLTHVEVWLGDGVKTIGARWQKGKVQVFDSYKFEAKSYHSETYIFKSIDTWLMGICRSHCDEHKWLHRVDEYIEKRRRLIEAAREQKPVYQPLPSHCPQHNWKTRAHKFKPSKKSVFAVKNQKRAAAARPENQDQSAGDTDDELLAPPASVQVPKKSSTKPKLPEAPSKSTSDVCHKGVAVTLDKVDNALDDDDNSDDDDDETSSDDSSDDESDVGPQIVDSVSEPVIVEVEDDLLWNCEPDAVTEICLDDESDINASDEDEDETVEFVSVTGCDKRVESTGENCAAGCEEACNSAVIAVQEVRGDGLLRNEERNNGNGEKSACASGENKAKTLVTDKREQISSDETLRCEENGNGNAEASACASIESKEKNFATDKMEQFRKMSLQYPESSGGRPKMISRTDRSSRTRSADFGPYPDAPVPANVKYDESAGASSSTRGGSSYSGNQLTFLSLLKYSMHNRRNILMPDAFSDLAVTGKAMNRSEVDGKEGQKSVSATELSKGSDLEGSTANSDRPVSAPSSANLAKEPLSGSRNWTSRSPWSKQDETNGNNSNNSNNSDNSEWLSSSPRYKSQRLTLNAVVEGQEIKGRNTRGSHQTVVEGNDHQSTGETSAGDPTKDAKSLRTPNRSQGQGQNEDEGQGSGGERSADDRSPESPKGPLKLRSTLIQGKEPTFYIGGNNGVALVEGPLLELGWKRISDKHDNYFRLKWVECKSRINYNAFKEGEQMVNHIPNCNILTNKLGLLQSLRSYERINVGIRGREPRYRITDLLPETYRLDDPKEREVFFENHEEGDIWISKPVGLNQGKGIYLVRDIEAFKLQIQEKEQRSQGRRGHRPVMTRIIQRYIHNPLLLNGKKFDIRAYMLIASTIPFLVLFHQGYVRLCMGDYDINNQDLLTHLTNQFIQKRDPERYKEEKDNTVWSMAKLNDYINQQVAPHKGLERDWVHNILTCRMKAMMVHCFQAVKHKLQARTGFFELYGFDFLIDSNMKVWLIEINVNPCLATNCDALKEVVPDVVRESIYLSIECFEKTKRSQPLTPLQNLRGFQVLYNGATKSVYIPPPAARWPTGADSMPSGGHVVTSPSPRRRSVTSSPTKDMGNLRQSQGLLVRNRVSPDDMKTTKSTDTRAKSAFTKSSSWSPVKSRVQQDRPTLLSNVVSAEDLRENVVHTGLEFTQNNSSTPRLLTRSKTKQNVLGPAKETEGTNAKDSVSSSLVDASPDKSLTEAGSSTQPNKHIRTRTKRFSIHSKKAVGSSDEKQQESSENGSSKDVNKNATRPSSSAKTVRPSDERTVAPHVICFPEKDNENALIHSSENTTATGPVKLMIFDGSSNSSGSKESTEKKGSKVTKNFSTTPVLAAHSIQNPAISLDGPTCTYGPPGGNSIEERGN